MGWLTKGLCGFDRDFVFSANGCGTAMLPISSDVDFADCCNWHDAVRGVTPA